MSASQAGDLEKFWILKNPVIVNEIVVDSYVRLYIYRTWQSNSELVYLALKQIAEIWLD